MSPEGSAQSENSEESENSGGSEWLGQKKEGAANLYDLQPPASKLKLGCIRESLRGQQESTVGYPGSQYPQYSINRNLSIKKLLPSDGAGGIEVRK